MQDRFRVRVWNKKEKEMIYNAEFAYDGMNYNLEGELIGPNRNDGHICCLAEYLNDSNYESMQCTGLKDKNGKLIYEGDIVTPVYSNASLLEPPFTGQVVSGKACFEIKSPHIAYNALQILNSEKAFEIIGNIYENPELLESEER